MSAQQIPEQSDTAETRFGFPPEATAQFLATLTAAGAGARIGIRIAKGKAYLRVAKAEGGLHTEDTSEINNSFRCPPNTGCP